jgi:hypothetical protein
MLKQTSTLGNCGCRIRDKTSGADTTSMALTKAKVLSLGLKMRESLSLETLKRYENQCEVIFHKEVT